MIRNAIRCNICGDVIESEHRYDFVTYSCGAYFVDGGHDHLRHCFKEQGCYEIVKHIKFCDYAEYVLDLKERTGLSPTTMERYRSMLPRIFDGIGHLKLTDIRPFHLNDFYKHLAESGVRNKGAIATANELGHADANTTQAIYAHQIARARAEAAGVRAGVFSMLREA